MRLSVDTTFVAVNCFTCGVPFAMQSNFHYRLKSQGGSFYCPAGHKLTYGEGSKNEEIRRLNEQLEKERSRVHQKDIALRQEQSAHEYTENRRRAEKAAKTRIKNRVSKGVCPCCNRSFVNLRRHMASKHPDYTEATSE